MTPDDDNPPRYRPATPKQIAWALPIATAPRTYGLIVLLWRDEAGVWQAIHGQWRDEHGDWIADPVLTRSRELPSTPTHWCAA